MNLEKDKLLKNFSLISVVVQGPISETTSNACESVRRYLPNSHIILSTWKGSDCSNFDYDELVLSDDPQADGTKYPTNANRMILSAFAGLKVVKTKYVLKMRTDFILTSTNFIDLFFLEQPEPKEYKFFEKRVVSYVWKPQKDRLFQCGDFFFFGLTCDVIKLFDIPLCKKEDFFWHNNNNAYNPWLKRKNPNRYHTEQYIWLQVIKNAGYEVKMNDCTHFTEEFKELTERTFVNNLIFTSFFEFSAFTNKNNLMKYNYPIQSRGYSFCDWIGLCKKYLDENFKSSYKPKKPSSLLCFFAKIYISILRFVSILMPTQYLRQKVRYWGDYTTIKIFYNNR